jgi:hypothetical protein
MKYLVVRWESWRAHCNNEGTVVDRLCLSVNRKANRNEEGKEGSQKKEEEETRVPNSC